VGNKEYKLSHRANEICIDCSMPTAVRRVRCFTHLKSQAGVSFNSRNRYKKEGKCARCGEPLESDMDTDNITCLNCREGIGL